MNETVAAQSQTPAWRAYERMLALIARDAHHGWVYFIADGLGNVKIGKSRNPARRLSSLRSGSAQQLTLIGVIPGYSLVEAAAHDVLDRIRLQGEWFTDCELLRDFMTLHCGAHALALFQIGAVTA